MGVRLSIIFALAFCLLGCTPPNIELEVESIGEEKLVTLSQDWGFIFPDPRVPCVHQILLTNRPEDTRQAVPLWKIESLDKANCGELSHFLVGKTPKHFEETIPLRDQLNGENWIHVRGIGFGSAQVSY